MGSARFEFLGSNNQDLTLKPFTERVQCGLGRSGQLLGPQCLLIFIADFGVCMSGGPGLPPCLEVPSIIHVLPDNLPRGSAPRLLP